MQHQCAGAIHTAWSVASFVHVIITDEKNFNGCFMNILVSQLGSPFQKFTI